MSTLFSMNGRISRKQYFWWTIAVVAVTYFVAFVAGFVAGMTGSAGGTGSAAGILGFIVGLAGAVVQGFLVVRRLHDIGKPGWHYWLFLIPLYNIYLGIVLLFTPGESGSNAYGNSPA